MSKKPSMDDVARQAGVSKFTVCRSLRGEKGVSEETRKRIIDIADELGYVYDTKCTSNDEINSICIINNKDILLLRKKLIDTYYAVQAECIKEKIRNIVYFYDEDVLYNEIPICIKDGVAKGILIIGEITEGYWEKLKYYNVPMVMVETYLKTIYGNKILLDNVKAGYDATMYLINKGHSNIAFYTDDNGPAYIERWLGYVQATKCTGLKVLHVLNKDNFKTSLQKEQCSAIVLGNTESLINIEQKLNTMRVNIPDEMSIIVFDDCDTTGIDDKYNLTRVTVPKVELGVAAVKSLLYTIENPGNGEYKILIQAGIKEGQTVKNLDQPKGDDMALYD